AAGHAAVRRVDRDAGGAVPGAAGGPHRPGGGAAARVRRHPRAISFLSARVRWCPCATPGGRGGLADSAPGWAQGVTTTGTYAARRVSATVADIGGLADSPRGPREETALDLVPTGGSEQPPQ